MRNKILIATVVVFVLSGCDKGAQNYVENGVVKTINSTKKSGEVAIPAQFYYASPFRDNTNYTSVAIGAGFSYGVIDKNGKFIINPQYKFIGIRSGSDFIVVQNNAEKWGLYFHDKLKIPPQFDLMEHPSEDLIATKLGDTWGYINLDGKIVINPIYQMAKQFSEGLAFVKLDGKYGVIDKSGVFLIAPQFDGGYFFRDSTAVVTVGGKAGIIDKSGKFLVNPQYEDMKVWPPAVFSEVDANYKLIPIKSDGKWGYIETNGTIKISPQFDQASFFYDDMAVVKIGDKFGYINSSGKFMINPVYEKAQKFYNDKAVVGMDGKHRFINKDGSYVSDAKFDFLDGDSDLVVFYNYIDGKAKSGYVYR